MDATRKTARKWIDSLSTRVQQVLFAAATYLILLAICMLAISPEQYDLSVGDVAPKTITASKDIVDEITTARRRQAASDAVSPVYYKDDTVSDTVLSEMDRRCAISFVDKCSLRLSKKISRRDTGNLSIRESIYCPIEFTVISSSTFGVSRSSQGFHI